MVITMLPVMGLANTYNVEQNDIAYAVEGGNIYYRVSNNAITVTGADESVTAADIPTKVNGAPVKEIGDSAFRKCSRLKSIVIPEGVTSIGGEAFSYCSSLESVVIPEGVTSIGEYAFDCCSSLTTVVIPEGVTSIGNSAFENCSGLTSVTIPEGVTSIGSTFGGCINLTSVTIPSSVTSIGNGAFGSCESLTSIVIPENVTSIGGGAFWGCGSLTTVVIPDSVTSIGYGAFEGCSGLTSVFYGGDDNSWSSISIEGCNEYLTNATIYYMHNSVAPYPAIGGNIYFDKSTGAVTSADAGVTAINIPAKIYGAAVSSINTAATNGQLLASIDVDSDNTTFSSYDGTLYSKTMKTLIRCPRGKSEITIPASVKSVQKNAFSGCGDMTVYYEGSAADWENVTINAGNSALNNATINYASDGDSVSYHVEGGNIYFDKSTGTVTGADNGITAAYIPEKIAGVSVTSIGANAFEGCADLKEVSLSAGVTSIGNYAFSECESLTGIIIPEGVTRIGEYTFGGCGALETVVAPKSLTTVASGAFYLCNAVEDVYYEGKEYDWSLITISATGNNTFKNANKTYEYGNVVKYPVEGGDLSFNVKTGTITKADNTITAAEIPGSILGVSVTSIGNNAFKNCRSLSSVTIHAGVTSILASAFSGCSALTSVTIPTSVTSIGDYAFYSCSSLTSLVLPEGVENIGTNVFVACSNLRSLTIPSSVKKMGAVIDYGEDLSYTPELERVIISDVGAWCRIDFFDDYNLILNPLECADHLYLNGKKVTELKIPEGVTSIADSVFKRCHDLVSVEFPGSVINIGAEAFAWCDNLTSVSFGEGIKIIGNDNYGHSVFSHCSNIKTITIPATTTQITQNTFQDCTNLQYIFYGGSRAQWEEITIESGNDPLNNATLLTDGVMTYDASGGQIFFNYKTGTVTGAEDTVTSVVIPTEINGVKVTAIGERAFAGCAKLSKVTIPNGITSIGDAAFERCSALTSVTIPATVTEIGAGAFGGCTKLTGFNIAEGNKSFVSANGALFTADGATLVQYPAGVAGAYEIPKGTAAIAPSAFSDCSKLTAVTIPASVKSIGEAAFFGCTGLDNIAIPEGPAQIAPSMLAGCSNLLSVTIPESVKEIGASAFYGCTKLAAVSFNGSEGEWKAINVGSGNTRLTKATVTYAKPNAVKINAVTATENSVEFTWDGALGVDGYRIYKKTGTGAWKVLLSDTADNKYTDTDVSVGKTYRYTVRAHTNGIYSPGYDETAVTVTIKPAAEPVAVTISAIKYENGAVSLSWNEAEGVDGYRIYRKLGTGKWTVLVSSTTDTSYTDDTVTEGKTYSYTIRSYVGKNYSTGYDATAETIKAATAEPVAVTISSIKYNNGAVSLSWNEAEGVDGYRIYRKLGTGKWTVLVSSTTDTSYTDDTVTEGKTYSYTIRSYVGKNYSTGYDATAETIKTAASGKLSEADEQLPTEDTRGKDEAITEQEISDESDIPAEDDVSYPLDLTA